MSKFSETLDGFVDSKTINGFIRWGGIRAEDNNLVFDAFFVVNDEVHIRPVAVPTTAADVSEVVEAAIIAERSAIKADLDDKATIDTAPANEPVGPVLENIVGLDALQRVTKYVETEPDLPSGAKRETVPVTKKGKK